MFSRFIQRVGLLSALWVALTSSALAGSLTGSSSTTTSTLNLSTYGTLDWAHFGDGSVPGINKRSSSPNLVNNFTVVGGTATAVTGCRRSVSWSGGTPSATSSNNFACLNVAGIGNGFRLTFPADAQRRTVRVNFDVVSAGAQLRATLSDSSAVDYVSNVSQTSGARQYTLTYSADGPGRTLTVTFLMTSGSGSLHLVGAGAPTFTYVNHAPTLSAPASLTVHRGEAASVGLTGVDIDGDTLTWSATSLPPGLTINPSSGLITGTPTTLGSFNAVVTVRDPSNATATANIAFTVDNGSNTSPSSASGTFSTPFQTAVTFTPTWVDPDTGDAWAVAILSQPAHGSATASGTSITYTPAAGYVGSDSFTFNVTDSAGAFTTGTATGSVTATTPDQVSTVSASQGTFVGSVQLTWSAALNAVSYDVLRGTSASDPSPVLLGNTALLNYADPTASPGVQYWYSVVSRNGPTTAAPSPTSSGFSDTPPLNASATFAATLNTPLSVTPEFTDPDSGDVPTLAVVTQPSHGNAVVNGSVFTYTPDAGYVGADSFTFSLTDRAGASVVGTATGSVTALTPAPVASVSATQGTVVGAVNLSWTAASNALTYNVLRGNSASDPSPTTVATVASTSYSDLSAAPGVQYFYSVQSLTVGQSAAPSPASLGYADTPPTGATASFAAILETALQVTPSFTDPDSGDTATFAVVTPPSHGSASVVGNVITYTPAAGYVGPDSFSFSVTDRAGASTTGTASGTVTALAPSPATGVTATQGTRVASVDVAWSPAANALSYRVLRGTSASDPSPSAIATVTSTSYSDTSAAAGVQYYYSIQSLTVGQQAPASSSVLGFADTPPSGANATFTTSVGSPVTFAPNFVDPDAGDVATYAVTAAPTHGTVSVVAGGFRYTPDVGYYGPDSFSFSVTDRAGASASGIANGTVTITAPDPIAGLLASNGTQISTVQLSWNSSANTTTYRVFRGTSATDPSPVQIGTLAGTTFTDSGRPAGEVAYYSVQPFNYTLPGPMSAVVSGYADTPPTAAAGTFITQQNRAITFVPTWVDPDVGDSFTISVTGQPVRGTAVVVANQLVYTPTTGYVGDDQFTFSVTDRAGATVSGTATGTVQPGVPAAPLGFVVSQGTNLGGVSLNWVTTSGSLQYLVSRSQTRSNPSPEVIATVSENTFIDTTATPGAIYYYRIQGVGTVGVGPYSEEVSGYADTPPSGATASASTVFNLPVTFAPSVVDPDPAEIHTLAITTPPANGTLTIDSQRTSFNYLPNTGFSGVDTFQFTATDVAGASVPGSGSVAVGCPAPTIAPLLISQPKVFAGSGFTVSTTYGNTGCPVPLDATFEVMSGSTVVSTQTRSALPGAVSAPLAFPVDGLQAGNYVLKLTLTDSVTRAQTHVSTALSAPSYRMPTFTATGVAFADLDVVTLAVGRSDDCTITSNRSAAIGDHSLCFFEVTNIPPGVVIDNAQALPTWVGRPNIPGAYAPTLTVYQYDDLGQAKQLGQIARATNVQPITAMTFTAPTTVDVAQYLQQLNFGVQQASGPTCPVTTDHAAALAATLRGVRSCYVQYSPLPARSTITPSGFTAYFNLSGASSIGWQVSTFDVSGTEIRFASGTVDVNVRPVDINFVPSVGDRNPIATVTRASVRLVNQGADSCGGTVDATKANVTASDRPCLIEWLTIPAGLAQDVGTDAPLLAGIMTQVGQVPVSFNVSYYDNEGVKQTLLTATKVITVDPPPLPTIVMKGARQIAPDTLTVPTTGGLLGTLVTEVGKWPLDATITWSDDGVPQTFRINPLRGTQIVSATPAALWTSRDVTIRLTLRDAPDLFTEKVFHVHSVPVDGIRLGLDGLGTNIPDSENFPVTARIDMSSRAGPIYDPLTMGSWAVQFGFKDNTGNFVPSGTPVTIDANGLAQSTLNPFGLTLVRVMAQAVPVTSLTEYTRKLESPLRLASVVKGTPIEGTISVRGTPEGPAPYVAVLRAGFNTRSDQLANETVTWKRSSDSGVTWVDMENTGLQVLERLNEGVYQYKAVFTNRNTHVSSESNVATVRVWAVPKISLTGSTYAFPGSPISLTVNLTQPSGVPVENSVTEWVVNRRVVVAPGEPTPPPVASGTGNAITFTGDQPGQYMVTVRSRMSSSNPDDPRAWGRLVSQATYGAPERPFARIVGPVRAEVGKPYTYELVVRTRYDITKTSLRLAGRWTLPDGSKVDSLSSIPYTASDADLALGKFISLKYEAWVVGYEETTTTSTTLSLPIWKYVWPNWSLVTSVVVPYAPTNSRINVIPSDSTLLPTLEGLTYSWTVPSTMRVLTAPTSKLDSTIDYGGAHPVSVTIADARGNSTTLDTTITVADAKPFVINMPVNNLSKWTHAPLNVGLYPKVSGGHPQDSIVSWNYYLNGQRLDLPNKNTAIIALDSPGTHNIELRIASRMGASGTQSATVTVQPNVPASCAISAAPTTNRLMIVIQANCSDPDGAVTKYEWSVNGVPQTLTSGYKWSYVLPAGTHYPVTIDLTTTDDGGGRSTSSVVVN